MVSVSAAREIMRMCQERYDMLLVSDEEHALQRVWDSLRITYDKAPECELNPEDNLFRARLKQVFNN